ncbi:helix-turn-helix transcriptional regulator [Ornithinimicrobium faecis]|uniref:Helix-turn-helix transcriptional regulator n=1 Tax=Ornithinimicrobium faecis TaxID=2934158 RepID=A0ABY4YXD1_9MICO|nr:helix-turn-helix transcriptional regulator [Ornithinimicrobium sp. HY1793]USQ81443.1 helix-turn-helix transcriptional regulator [Ornithinimicrobium sp. HY1793]
MNQRNAFWDDLARDLQDPAFLRDYVVESLRIATIDDVVNALDNARAAAGLSKAELARAIHKEPATIRRLLSSDNANPTLGTVAEVAAALGLRISVEPISDAERHEITTSLLEGHTADPRGLAEHLDTLRARTTRSPA